MKHLNEDELLMAAFDEAESMSLDELDQEQKREFAALSGLKLDLKKLNDIPPCQLSSERLRRRILEDGIKTQKTSRSNWFFFASTGAVSCACMALAAVMIWNWYQPAVQRSSTAVAMTSEPAATLDKATPSVLPEAVNTVREDTRVSSSSGDAVAPTPIVREPRRSRSSRSARRPAMTTVAMAMNETGYVVRSEDDPAMKTAASAPEVVDSMPPAISAAEPSPELPGSSAVPVVGGKPSVIIIGQAPGQQPPAVESSGHVVFGG